MRFSTLVVTALATSLATTVQASGRPRCIVEEVSLGVDPRHNGPPAEVLIDVHRCTKRRHGREVAQPLVVFSCGGSTFKTVYNTFASGLARRGYVVAVIEHPFSFSPAAPPLNFATAVDVSNAIAYMENQSTFAVDTDQIVLMGHSFGGGVALNAINENCAFPFCQDPNVPFPSGVTVPLHPGVVLGAVYGGSLNNQQGGFANFNNLDIPFGFINGAGDINYFNELAGENLTQGTFDRLNATKVIATIDNLDHFSISEVNTAPDRGDIPSTLPLDVQIRTVTRAMARWIKLNLKNNPTNNFCNQMNNFDLVDCLEEYA